MVLFVSGVKSLPSFSSDILYDFMEETCDKYFFVEQNGDLVLAFSEEKAVEVMSILCEFDGVKWSEKDPLSDKDPSLN